MSSSARSLLPHVVADLLPSSSAAHPSSFPRALPHTRHSSLSDLISLVDILSVHCPLNSSTRHLLGAKELATMKPSAIVINTARGGIIDEVALEDALRNGVIGGVGCDVWEVEPPTWEKYGGLFSLRECSFPSFQLLSRSIGLTLVSLAFVYHQPTVSRCLSESQSALPLSSPRL